MKPLDFLVLSTTDWDAPQFGSRQQIALQLVRRGHRVLFVDVARSLHSLVSDPAGTRRALRRLGKIRQLPAGPMVYTPPPVLPVYYNPLTNALSQRLLVGYLRRTLALLEWRVDVVWTYWPNTAFLIGRLGERAAVYHCIDDFAAVGYPLTTKRAIARMEAAQCRKVDIIFARTAGLADAKRSHNPNTHLLPGGVDVAHFNPARVPGPPASITALPRPRVGLVGTIDDRVDIDLLVHCARGLPKVTFVFVGPVRRHRVDVRSLEELPNVRFLPPIPHSDVPALLSALDAGLIPYRINAYTQGLSPIKLYEYMALGLPVVATDLPYLHREAEHICIVQTPDEFALALRDVVAHPQSTEDRARGRDAAKAQSWESQVDQIETCLAAVLEER